MRSIKTLAQLSVFIVISIYTQKAFCQKNQVKIIITGNLDDINPTDRLNSCSISIINGKALDPYYPIKGSKESYPIVVRENQFKLVIPVQSKYCYFQVNVTKKRDMISSGFTLIKSGDSLHIDFRKESNVISGNNKFLIDFYNNEWSKLSTIKGQIMSEQQINEFFLAYHKLIHNSANNFNRTSNDIEIKTILESEVNAKIRLALFKTLYRIKSSENGLLRACILQNLKKMDINWISENRTIFKYSVSYIASVFSFYELKTMISLPVGSNYFPGLYETISKIEEPDLRDKLLAYLFWRKFENSGLQGAFYLNKALNLVSSPIEKEVLEQLAKAKMSGSEVFPFKLSDTLGKVVEFKSFKGRALVIHFWFTGCAACKRLTPFMDPIIQNYRNHPYVRFLSVNIDRDEMKWKRSLKSGEYSNEFEIPLFTQGLGNNHPFLKYYNIVSYPHIIIINRSGKLVTSNAPIITNLDQSFDFRNLINKALIDI